MILMLGDIHGNYKYLKNEIEGKNLRGYNIIQVGDFGVGKLPAYDQGILERLDQFLNEWDVNLYVIRGNHDDPKYFQGSHIFNNLKLLPDYTILKIEDYNFLFVGGATSIDRKYSLKKMQVSASYGLDQPLYWFGEEFILDEDRLSKIENVDIVVTHTAPEWCIPDNRVNGFGSLVMEFAQDDPNLIKDLEIERSLMSKMFNILSSKNNIKKHFYGHFHRSDITLNGMTTHYLLGIGEFMLVDDYTENDYEKIFI